MSADDIGITIKQYDIELKLTGSMGPTGPTGATGPQGPRGLPGTTGTSSADDITIQSGTTAGHGDIILNTNNIDRVQVTYDGRVLVGFGDNQNVFANTGFTTGKLQSISLGKAGAPDTGLQPALKVSRLVEVPNNTPQGDGAEQMAALSGVSRGTVNNQAQPIGVYGGSTNAGNYEDPTVPVRPDAVGVYGVGYISAGGVGAAFGGFFSGRKASVNSGARARGLEIVVNNQQTGYAALYDPNSIVKTDTIGIHLAPVGIANSAAGLVIGAEPKPTGNPIKFLVGIAFTGQNNHEDQQSPPGNRTYGSILNASIRDDGGAVYSIQINGNHNYALTADAGAGSVIVGRSDRIYPESLFEVWKSGTTPGTPMVAFVAQTATDEVDIRFKNAVGAYDLFVAGNADRYLAGTIQGDAGIRILSTPPAYPHDGAFHIGGTVSVIKVTEKNDMYLGVTTSRIGIDPHQVWENSGMVSVGDAIDGDGLVANSFTTGMLVPYSPNNMTDLVQVQNRAYLVRFVATKKSVRQISFYLKQSSAYDDHIEIAIYNLSLSTKLATSGDVGGKLGPSLPSGSIQTVTLGGGSFNLTLGQTYYVAFLFRSHNGTGTSAIIGGASFPPAEIMGATLPNLIQAQKDSITTILPVTMVPTGSTLASAGVTKSTVAPILGLLQ